MQASAILDRAGHALLDTGHTRWTEAELLLYLSDAQRLVATHKPDAAVVSSTETLVEGAVQQLPAGAHELRDVLGATFVDRQILDRFDPGWLRSTPRQYTAHYMYDARERGVYYVYPPAEAGTQLTLRYVAEPSELSATTDELIVSDALAPVLTDYVVFRAYVKDSDDTLNLQRAQAHLQMVNQALGTQFQVSQYAKPSANDPQKGIR